MMQGSTRKENQDIFTVLCMHIQFVITENKVTHGSVKDIQTIRSKETTQIAVVTGLNWG
jgi:hypothetical protein